MPQHPHQSLVVSWGNEQITVSNLGPDLPAGPGEADVRKVVEAGTANPATRLPEAALHAIGRATTGPDSVAVQLRSTAEETDGLLMAENVDGATLHSVITRAYFTELLPGIQPRTGVEHQEVDDPQVQGVTDDGHPCAILQYRYRDLEHLRNHIWQTIYGTLSLNSYAISILRRKVTRSLITHPVEICFEDGTESFHALTVRDGITRLASAWAVLAGPGADHEEAATLAVDTLFGRGPAPAGDGSPLGDRLAAGRERRRASLREEYDQQMDSADPGLRAAQIVQTYVVPVQIAVGVTGHGRLLASEDLFDDAIRSVLASIHVEFKEWKESAQNIEVATRALKRVIQAGDSAIPQDDLKTVYGLAVGRIPFEDLPKHFPGNDAPVPATALWRAVCLVHALTRPELMDLLKDQAKLIKGGRRMSTKGYAELLGPIIDLPWRSKKKLVTTQARNAWKNGGVLTSTVTSEWEPVPTHDFTTLVAPALAGDTNARCTLAVAGGVALIADKLLTRNVGSSLSASKVRGGVPFRADVNLIVDGLSRPSNERGLWTLALAANRFRSDALPENAATSRPLIHRDKALDDSTAPYVHYALDLEAEDKAARDADGVPELLHQWDVVWDSDSVRATANQRPVVPQAPDTLFGPTDPTDSKDADVSTAPAVDLPHPRDPDVPDTRPVSQRAAGHRQTLRRAVTVSRDALDRLLELEPEVGGHTPIIPVDALDDLHKVLIGLQTDVENLRRSINSAEDPSWEDEEV
ncbi:hypothetical protein [Streptomyces sp. NPDC058401]|uniref:hypothetical protein n=1 Tax=Streptomyces sp. NPDC058401 TaxID=3346480 RepID=UPI003656F58E